MDREGFFLMLFITSIVASLCFIGVGIGLKIDIETKKPLEYKLKIEIENGVSDTTYIYER